MAEPLITEADLLLALDGGAETLRELCGDDGNGVRRADRLAYGIAVASEQGYGLLMAGFTTVERVQALAAEDTAVRHALCMIFREALASGKKEHRLPDGKTVFTPDAAIARDLLRGKASGSPRTSAEEVPTVGASSVLRPRASSLQPARPALSVRSGGRPVGF